jgi:DnaJ family protein C protein 17
MHGGLKAAKSQFLESVTPPFLAFTLKMPSDDLLEHAKSDQDFYALLGAGVHPGSAEGDIRRAYRRTALKHHPDKNKDDPDAVIKFHALQIAFDVLSDPAAKAAYDNARLAREHKRRQREVFEGRRRTMMEDLERRESGALKRKRDEAEAEEALERELRRLQEDGRRRRMEREEALRKEVQRGAGTDFPADASPSSEQTAQSKTPVGGTHVPEIQRTVKVRWLREGAGESLDKDRLSEMFSRFGIVESAFTMKDRKVRLGDAKKKKTVGNGIIVFSSIVSAHAAVEDAKKAAGAEWDVIESVEWDEGKEPDIGLSEKSTAPSSPANTLKTPEEDAASTPRKPPSETRRQFPGLDSDPSTPFSAKSTNGAGGDGLRKVPSFASFRSANPNTPVTSPFSKGINSPSLEEITMIRLKNAEKKRLEEKIRREEAEAAANEEEAAS